MAAPNRAGAAPLAAHFGGTNGRTESAKVPRINGQNKMRDTSVSGVPNAKPLTTGHIASSQPLHMSADSNTLTKGAAATSRPKRQFDVLRDDVPAEIGDNVHKKRKLSPPSAPQPTGDTGKVGHGTACPTPINAAGGAKPALVQTHNQDTNAARNSLLADFKDAASHAGLPDSENALEILKNVLMAYDVSVKAGTPSLSHGIAQTVVAGDVADQDLPSSVTEPNNKDLVAQFCDNPSEGSPSSQTNKSGDEQNATDVPVDQDDTTTVNDGLVGENGVTAAAPKDTTGVEKTDNTDKDPATTAVTDSNVINKEPNVLNQAQVAPVPSQATVELPLTVSTQVPALRIPDITALNASQLGADVQEVVDEPSRYGLPRNLTDSFYCPEDILEEALQGALIEFQDDVQEPLGDSSFYGPPRNPQDSFYCPDDVQEEVLQTGSAEFQADVQESSFYGPPRNLHDGFYCPEEFLPEAFQGASMEPQCDVQEPTGEPSFYGPPRNLHDAFYCPDDVLQEVLQNQMPEQPSVGNSLLRTTSFLAPGQRLGLTPLVVNGAVQRPRSSLLTSLGPAESTTSATSSFEATMGSFSQATPVVPSSVALHHLPYLATYGDPDPCLPLPYAVDPRYPASLRKQISERRIKSRADLDKIRVNTFQKGQSKGHSLEQMVEDHKRRGRRHVQRFQRIEQELIEDYRESLYPQANQKVQRTGVSPTASTLGKCVRFADPEDDDVQFVESRPVKRSRTTDDVKPLKTPRSILKRSRQRKNSD